MAKGTTTKKTPSKVLKNDVDVTAITKKQKRKAESTGETLPPKKTKVINDGNCVFVGNLNASKTFEEVTASLEKFFMTQSLIVQDIRLAKSRKHAFMDLASNMDVTKALSLDGEIILGQPLTIDKAKVKIVDSVKKKKKAPKLDQKAKDSRCLFLKNVPYNATKKDIKDIFPKAIDIRFPDQADRPDKGIAFLEFKNETIASKMRTRKKGAMIQERVLIIDPVGVVSSNKKKNTKPKPSHEVEISPSTKLFVSNLPFNVTEKKIKHIFKKALTITMPKNGDKANGYAFVEFATVADAEKAMNATKKVKILKRLIKVQFSEKREQLEIGEVESKKLFVSKLSDKTTTEILQEAFQGCLNAKVATDRVTGKSKRFGFVEYENEEMCAAAKKAMEDSEINGTKVSVCYARSKSK